jgi:hypothetical protein
VKYSKLRRWIRAIPGVNLWLAADVTEAGVRISAPIGQHNTSGSRIPRRPMKPKA